jgi:hypothetical protein
LLWTGKKKIITTLMMEAVRASGKSVYSNEITRRYIPEGSQLHTRRRENLKSHVLLLVYLILISQPPKCIKNSGGTGLGIEFKYLNNALNPTSKVRLFDVGSL